MNLLRQPKGPTRILHTMLRVSDLDRSLGFYCTVLGMTMVRRADYRKERFTLAFLGYGIDDTVPLIELTHNWDPPEIDRGTGFGHIALEVADFAALGKRLAVHGIDYSRPPGPMKFDAGDGRAPDYIAFIEDPDGYQIELIQRIAQADTPRRVLQKTAGFWL